MAKDWARSIYVSQAWRDLRAVLIHKRGAVCQRCNKIMIDTSQLVGHHIVELTPENVLIAEVAFNPDNIELICCECHNKEHNRFGYITERKIYIVYGSPCSGKTTLVNQMKVRGDLIIDVDVLFMAISGCCLYDKPDNLKGNVFKVRDLLLDQIKTRYGRWGSAYIIGGYPKRQERENLAMKLGAELIYVSSTIEESLERAKMRGVFSSEWQKYIVRWFDEYEAPHSK